MNRFERADEGPASGDRQGEPAETRASRVSRHIRDGIRLGRLVPGQRLVESDLMSAVGASRSSIREALTRLGAEGLIEISTHRGAMVRRMRRRDVEEFYQIREPLEGLAARLAAERIGAGDAAKRLVAALRRSKSAGRGGGDAESYSDANQLFHAAIIGIADNATLVDLLERLNLPLFRLQFRSFLKPTVTARSADDHDGIAAAILEGNAADADRLMRAHVRRSAAVILSLPDALFG